MSFHWFDFGAALFVLACIAYSSLRGFVKEVFTVLAWVIGYFGSVTLHPTIAPYAKKVIKTSLIADIGTFFFLFGVLYIGVRLVGHFSHKKLGFEHIPAEINHGAGAIMGVAKGVFFLAIFLSPLSYFPSVKEKFTKNSIAADLVLKTTKKLSTGDFEDLPKSTVELKETFQELKGEVVKRAKQEIKTEIQSEISEEKGGANGSPPLKSVDPVVKVKNSAKESENEESRKQMNEFIDSFH